MYLKFSLFDGITDGCHLNEGQGGGGGEVFICVH